MARQAGNEKEEFKILQQVINTGVSTTNCTHEDNLLRSFAMTNLAPMLISKTLQEPRTLFISVLQKVCPCLWLLFCIFIPRQQGALAQTGYHFVRSERDAVLLFKIGALGYKLPVCKYLYGHALIYGTGGITKNIPKVIAFLHEAGQPLIAEAFFELGTI